MRRRKMKNALCKTRFAPNIPNEFIAREISENTMKTVISAFAAELIFKSNTWVTALSSKKLNAS